MDKLESSALLRDELAKYRTMSYAELAARVDAEEHRVEHGPSGTEYQVEIQIIWDDKPGGDVRVMAWIDDGGWRAFFPLGECFIMSPDGAFVDEC